MLNILKRKKDKKNIKVAKPKIRMFGRLKSGLSKTKKNLADNLANSLLGKKTIDASLIEEIETALLIADLGIETTQLFIENLTNQLARKQLHNSETVLEVLKEKMVELLATVEAPLTIDQTHKPYVILMVGVNGAGKTTTIGKLAKKLQTDGKKVMLAAGDTFRAAAVEQLQVWGERNQIPVIAQQTGADSASVIFDAIESAKARNIDVLIADTAGRLHTQNNLMEELKKIQRVIRKADATAPHETMLVLDSGIGQNTLQQAKQFNNAIGVTGLTLTKLDGTAKGGIIFAIANQLGIPIRFIGVGEKIDDLRPFQAKEFVEALF
jgi:fused signal recognition particle receptor